MLARLLDEDWFVRGRVPHDDVGGMAVMSRYSWGADEHLFVELAEEMSLQANFRAMAIATKLRERPARRAAGHLPRERVLPGALRPGRAARPRTWRRCCAGVDEEVGDAHGVLAGDAGRRGAGALRRPVDERDPDEVPRPPSGAGLDRPRVRGADQRLRVQGASSSTRTRARRGSPRWSGSSPGCRSCTRWSRASGSSRCRSTCARARTRRR